MSGVRDSKNHTKNHGGLRDTAFHAVTLRAPWAMAIIYGPKRVENRRYPIKLWTGKVQFRDVWLAVHVSSSFSARDKETTNRIGSDLWSGIHEYDHQAIVGRIVGVIHVSKVSGDFNEALQHQGPDQAWLDSGSRYYWLIDKVQALTPTEPIAGRQRVWKVMDERIVSVLQEHVKCLDGEPTSKNTSAHVARKGRENKQREEAEEGSTDERTKKKKCGKASKKRSEALFSREDVSLAFHILNQTGSGRLNTRDIVECSKNYGMDISEAQASLMIQYANKKLKVEESGELACDSRDVGWMTMDAYMKVAEEQNICPLPDTKSESME
eukprot:CAMPEP_0184482394 /NCGR_PEP_ID=MMETSP0113_2-20130426/3952_1 /TAXON_ID=91329 /ORGANISM="Norrisiella sphaerica, Strain BC52" /LENGTH=324 /DNA_ID=CAMNT_0026862093 /DNA_START=37 /DNA_END=1011 /DNA_ORIENTATION=-